MTIWMSVMASSAGAVPATRRRDMVLPQAPQAGERGAQQHSSEFKPACRLCSGGDVHQQGRAIQFPEQHEGYIFGCVSWWGLASSPQPVRISRPSPACQHLHWLSLTSLARRRSIHSHTLGQPSTLAPAHCLQPALSSPPTQATAWTAVVVAAAAAAKCPQTQPATCSPSANSAATPQPDSIRRVSAHARRVRAVTFACPRDVDNDTAHPCRGCLGDEAAGPPN